MTHSAIAGVAILMAWISVCAPLLPTVSISQAVLSTSSRACSMRTRDSAIQSRTTPCSASGRPNATRSMRPPAQQLQGPLGHADQPHAVVDPARARAGPGRWRSRSPSPPIRFAAGTRTSVEGDLGVPAVRRRRRSRRRVMPRRTSTPGVSRGTRIMLCWRCRSASGSVLPITMKISQRGSIAPGRPPLAAVDHVLVAVAVDPGGDVGGVGGGDLRLGHAERRADLAVQQRRAASAPAAPASRTRPAPPCCRCPARRS